MAKATIEPFDGGDFAEYRERLEFFFCANDIGVVALSASSAEKTKVEKHMTSHLISMLSKTVYATLKTLCLPATPKDKKYVEICALLEDHYKVQTSRTTATYLFRQCVQSHTESVTDFAHRLKKGAVDCEFGSFLDRALRDQFIAGLRDLGMKKTILTKPDSAVKSFDSVFQLAITEEMAGKFAQQMQAAVETPSGSESVNKVKTRPKFTSHSNAKDRKCFRCGSADHLADKCRHKTSTCHYCERTGHLERVCRQKIRQDKCHRVQECDEELCHPEDNCQSGESVPMFHLFNTSS